MHYTSDLDVDTDRAAGKLPVNPPVGGYMLAACTAALAILCPFIAIDIGLNGDVASAVLLLFIGTPMFAYLAKWSVALNDDIRAYRGWLRANHQWIHALGVVIRLGFVMLLLIAAVIDVVVFSTPVWIALGGLLAVAIGASMVSVCMSLIGRGLRNLGGDFGGSRRIST